MTCRRCGAELTQVELFSFGEGDIWSASEKCRCLEALADGLPVIGNDPTEPVQ